MPGALGLRHRNKPVFLVETARRRIAPKGPESKRRFALHRLSQQSAAKPATLMHWRDVEVLDPALVQGAEADDSLGAERTHPDLVFLHHDITKVSLDLLVREKLRQKWKRFPTCVAMDCRE